MKQQRYYYIYIITNTITKMSYVGSRFYEFNEPYFGSSKELKKDINKNGLWNYSKQAIGIYPFIDRKERDKREGDNMELYDTLYPNGYNRYDPRFRKGFNMCGMHHSDQSKRKMSKSSKNQIVSKETRKKLSDKHLGIATHIKPHSEETKQKISNSQKGKKPWNKGIKHSSTAKIKMSLAKIGKISPIKGIKQSLRICPHCGKTGGNSMMRWHFDNCKSRH